MTVQRDEAANWTFNWESLCRSIARTCGTTCRGVSAPTGPATKQCVGVIGYMSRQPLPIADLLSTGSSDRTKPGSDEVLHISQRRLTSRWCISAYTSLFENNVSYAFRKLAAFVGKSRPCSVTNLLTLGSRRRMNAGVRMRWAAKKAIHRFISPSLRGIIPTSFL